MTTLITLITLITSSPFWERSRVLQQFCVTKAPALPLGTAASSCYVPCAIKACDLRHGVMWRWSQWWNGTRPCRCFNTRRWVVVQQGEIMEKPSGKLKKTTTSQRSGEMVKQEKTCIKMCCHKVSNNQIAQYGKMNMGRNFPMDHRPPQLGSGDFAE